MATIEEVDPFESGMGNSDVRPPEAKFSPAADDNSCISYATSVDNGNDDEDIEDETLSERLLGLTEMFPKELRAFGYNAGTGFYACMKGLYALSCSATWLFFSSSAILFAPVIFEVERARMEELQRTQQKQVLLGPSTAMSNVGATGLPMAPPVQR